MMVQVCNCGVKAVIAESLDGQLACLRCRGRAQALAEYAAECRGCEACPDGICSRHHPDDRAAAMEAHPAPKAAPADPYEAHRVRRLNEASRPVDCDPIDHRCYRTLADATERAVSALGMAREQKAVADQNLARLEAALSECGDPDAIAEHGRKAGGA